MVKPTTSQLAVTTVSQANGEQNPLFKKAFNVWSGTKSNPVTFFPGQQVGADIPIEQVCDAVASAEPDGIELCDWGGVFDSQVAVKDGSHTPERVKFFKDRDLDIFALSGHLGSSLTNQYPITSSYRGFVGMIAPEISFNGDWLDNKDVLLVQKAAVKYVKGLAVAAGQLANEVGHAVVVNGFTGSPVWHMVHNFPGAMDEVDKAFSDAGEVWLDILSVYEKESIGYALEIHPGCMAFDPFSAVRMLEAVEYHPHFGFNHDPSHGQWMNVNAAAAARFFGDRLFHFHAKDTKINPHPLSGIMGGHLDFDDPRRGWTFELYGFGDVNFPEVGRALTEINYEGPVSSEQESSIIDWSVGHVRCIEGARRDLVLPANGIRFDQFGASSQQTAS